MPGSAHLGFTGVGWLKMIWDWSIDESLKVKLPTIWTDEKAEVGRVREEKRREEKKKGQRRERVRSKKMQVRDKVEKSRNTAFLQ